MEDNYKQELTEALGGYGDYIERTIIPELKDSIMLFRASFNSLFQLMTVKTRMLKENPYQYEQKISEIKVPSSGPFAESETKEVVGMRLSDFDFQLDFLVNYYQISLDFINLRRIKAIKELVEYIDWMDLSPNSARLMTRTVASLLETIKSGNDSIFHQLIIGSTGDLLKASRKILKALSLLSVYQKEHYKLWTRDNLFPAVTPSESRLETSSDTLVADIKYEHSTKFQDIPFYRSLVEEALEEDYSRAKEPLRKAVLEKLKIQPKVKKKTKKKVTERDRLKFLCAQLGRLAFELEAVEGKLKDNELAMSKKNRSIGERLSDWFYKFMHGEAKTRIYEIVIVDKEKGLRKRKDINMGDFFKQFRMKITQIKGLTNRNSSLFQKLEAATEKELYEYLKTNSDQLYSINQELDALDRFYKNNAPAEMKSRIRSLQVEIKNIISQLKDVIRELNAYSDRLAEQEQMRKLGINPEVEE